MAKDFPHPRLLVRATARKPDYLRQKKTNNAIHLVLARLCKQMDTMEVDDDSDEDDVAIFRSLVEIQLNMVASSIRTMELEKSTNPWTRWNFIP